MGLAGTMTATDTIMVTAKADKMDQVGPVMVTGALLGATVWWLVVR